MVGALVEHLAHVTPLATNASISYRKLAPGPILATARLSAAEAPIVERRSTDGRAEFDAEVEFTDASEVVVATMTVRWNVRKRG